MHCWQKVVILLGIMARAERRNIDTTIVEFINQFANASTLVDRLIGLWARTTLFKGGVLVALFYWAWFSFGARSKERNILLGTLVATPVIILIARLLALNLPFRTRPIHNENLHFILPTGVSEYTLDGWSSFPSDHMVLYFGFAVGIYMASKRLGLVGIFYTLIFIGLPRIYNGYHYPTDILGGMVIGGVLMLISLFLFADSTIETRIKSWALKRPGAFYALFFLITFEIVNLFDDSRHIATFIYRGLAHWILGS